jgi:hypothetical protein
MATVTVRIRGGLGNQLFTYACGYAAAKKQQSRLVIDISDYSNKYFRGYMLDNLKLENCHKLQYKFINNKIGRTLLRLGLKIKYNYIEEKNSAIIQDNININDNNMYLYGYWQSEKYFIEYSDEIIQQFQPKELKTSVLKFIQETQATNSIAVHIRRGDYINNNWALNLDYYNSAIEYIRNHVDNPTFYFFSDDLVWTKEQFGDSKQFIYFSSEDEMSDMDEFWCMSNCKNFVIANSTFSWWAAWLNRNPHKIILAPEYGIWSGDYYPNEWILIKANIER